MHFPLCSITILPLCLAPVFADFLGPRYPAPVDLSSNKSAVAAAWQNASSILQGIIDEFNEKNGSSSAPGNLASLGNITLSTSMFSLHDPAATKLEFHYTSAEIANSPNGTHKVDADTIYFVASVTKVMTVLAGLLELKESDWDRPLTDIEPVLAEYIKNATGQTPTYNIQWDKITPRALAAQIAGVPRDGFPSPSELILLASPSSDLTKVGFPPVNASDKIAYAGCASSTDGACPADLWLEGLSVDPPNFLPWTTPAYADNGFALLGLAIANMTGKTYQQLFHEGIFTPLGMTSSNVLTPPKSEWHRAAISGLVSETFIYPMSVYDPSGGISSTIADLAKLGVGILNSTLMPADQTRRWLKPVSNTARLQYQLGAPWEIIRYTLPNGVVTDIYTKSGDSGLYSGMFILLPDFDAGFNILAVSQSIERFGVVGAISDVIADSIIPALVKQAEQEAVSNYGGTYSSADQGLNSSLTLALNQTKGADPGLAVTSFISNGTDIVNDVLPLLVGKGPYRLMPSIVDLKGGKSAFQLVGSRDAPSAVSAATTGLFTAPGFVADGGDWIGAGSATYGAIGTSLMVFDVGSDRKAVSLNPAAFRITLKKTA